MDEIVPFRSLLRAEGAWPLSGSRLALQRLLSFDVYCILITKAQLWAVKPHQRTWSLAAVAAAALTR